jgi:hypothetical protein
LLTRISIESPLTLSVVVEMFERPLVAILLDLVTVSESWFLIGELLLVQKRLIPLESSFSSLFTIVRSWLVVRLVVSKWHRGRFVVTILQSITLESIPWSGLRILVIAWLTLASKVT